MVTRSEVQRHGLDRRLFLHGALALTASGSVEGDARAQTSARVLKYSDHEPLGGMRTRFIKDVLFPAVARETKGRLSIEDHWNGELAISYDALRAVRGPDGAADLSIVVPEYFANDLPLHQIFKSFPVGPTGARQVEFFRRAYAEIPAFAAELDQNDIVPVFLATGYPVAFFSAKPMRDLSAVRGGRWRIASFWHRDFLKNAGAVPVSMPWGPGIYDALRDGTLDGLMVNVDSGYMLKLHEVAPHVLVSKDLWLGHLYILAINKRVWNDLDPADRLGIEVAARGAYPGLGPVMDASFDAQVRDLRSAGATVRVLAYEEAKAWERTSGFEAIQTAWAQEQEARTGKAFAAPLRDVASLLQAFERA